MGLDGILGKLHDAGDVLHPQPFHCAEYQHISLYFGQLADPAFKPVHRGLVVHD